jgi:hypothetical protein
VQAVSQQTLSTQNVEDPHCPELVHAPPIGTGVLVGVAVGVSVGVIVGVVVGVAVGVLVDVGVLVGVVVGVALGMLLQNPVFVLSIQRLSPEGHVSATPPEQSVSVLNRSATPEQSS